MALPVHGLLAPLAHPAAAPAALGALALPLVRQLIQATVQGGILVAAVWAICRRAPRLPAGLRCALWWLASLKLLVALLWPAPLGLPWLPPAAAALGVATSAPAARDARAPLPLASAASSASFPEPASAAGATSPALELSLDDPRRSERPPAPAAAAAARPTLAASAPAPSHSTAASAPPPASPTPASPWLAALAALWLLGLLVQTARTLVELRHVRRLLRQAVPVSEPALLELAADLCRRLGLPEVTLLAHSPAAGPASRRGGSIDPHLPLTTGVRRPIVLLPADRLAGLSPAERAMTLCHELTHVRRRDLLWGWVPAAAARLFFFLPLAPLAAREYSLAVEAACDAAVLRRLGAAPAAYGGLLVRLGVARPGAAGRGGSPWPSTATAIGAASSLRQLKRRLEMLQHFRPAPARPRRLAWGLLVPLAAALLVPMHLTAAARTGAAAMPAPSAPAPPPAATPAAELPAPPAEADAPPLPPPAAAPAAAVPAPMAAMPPAPPPLPPTAALAALAAPPPPPPLPAVRPAPATDPEDAETAAESGDDDFLYSVGKDGEDTYVLLRAGHEVTMAGDTDDLPRARQAQRQAGGGDLLWVRHDGKEYAIRDAATLATVRELFRPQAELGAKQGLLGRRQGELGKRQGKLGAQQAALGAQMGRIAAERAAVSEAAAAAAEDAQGSRDLAARQRVESKADEARRDELAARMHQLGEQQRQLGDQQKELGEQQKQLGRQQSRLAHEASRKMHDLITKAVADGTAQPIR